MDNLRHQVRRARRRLMCVRFLAAATWTLCGALVVAVAAIAAPKLFVLGVDSTRWPWFWLGGAAALALVAASIWTKLTSGGELDAAIEVDRRYDLRERVSSSLALGSADRQTPAGQALVEDALRAIERVDVGDRFPVRVGRTTLLPLILAATGCLLACAEDREAADPAAASLADAGREQINKSADTLRRKLIERRKRARRAGLKDAEALFQKLEQGTRELAEKKNIDRKKALVKLNDLARQLERRRREIGGDSSIRQRLNQLKKLDPGPADRLAQALRKGDFRRAAEHLQKLQQQIRNGALDAETKAQLAKQLAQMEEKLRDLADAHRGAMDNLRNQIERARDAGDRGEAQRLQQMRDRLGVQTPQIGQLQRLAAKLGLCAQCMGQGDGQATLDALDDLAADLATMQEALDEVDMLGEVLAQIGECRGAMGCQFCGGAGCGNCRGHGLGEGQGVGPRPEEKTDASFYDSQVRQKPGKGGAVVTDLVEGPNVKGRVMEQIQAEVRGSAHLESDPLTDRRLPRAQREHAQEFFDSFRGRQD